MIVRAAPGWGSPGSIPGSALLANPGGLQISKGLVMNELEKDGANSGDFWHDGNDWKHCERVVYSGDLWAECVKCGAVMSWDENQVTR